MKYNSTVTQLLSTAFFISLAGREALALTTITIN